MTSSVSSSKFAGSKSVTIEQNKTYILEVTADVYSGGTWGYIGSISDCELNAIFENTVKEKVL